MPPEQIAGSRRLESNAECGMRNAEIEIQNPKSKIDQSFVTSAATNSKVGRYSDVYSLGAILYHCLTGRPPFLGESLTEILHQVLNVEVVPPRALNPSVPADLETICLKCLEKEPARRYATAKELADELGRFLKGEPVHARPIGPAGKAWRWSRRKPVLATLGALVLVLVLVVVIGAPIMIFRIDRARVDAERRSYAADMRLASEA